MVTQIITLVTFYVALTSNQGLFIVYNLFSTKSEQQTGLYEKSET